MFASLSIHFNLQCTDPSKAEILRYISNQKRHNTQCQSIMGPVSYSKPSARVTAYLNEHCSQPQPSLCSAQMFRFPISSPSLRGMLFFPRLGRPHNLKVNKLGRKMKHQMILLCGKHLILLREVSYVLCKVGW